MPVRIVKQEELLECKKIQSVAFVYPLDSAEQEKKLVEEADSVNRHLGFFNDENVITACVEFPDYQMRYEDNWVSMVGVGGVASLPEYRYGGAVRQIMQTALLQMLESGAVFSLLYPFSHEYYRKFGYELCQTAVRYELPVESLAKFRYTGKARMIHAGDSLEGLKTVFDAHFLQYNLPIRREERHWENLLGKDSYKDRVYTYLLEDEKGPSAYVVLSPEDVAFDKKIGNVQEIAFVRPQGLMDVLGLLHRLTAQYAKVRMPLPSGVPLSALVDESYDIKINFQEQSMARVINVQKALELKRHFEGATYTLHVQDDEIPANDGFFSVRCENGVVTATKKSGAAADLTANVRTLGQLLLGFLTIDEAVYKKDVEVTGNIETLRRVFVKREVFLTEHF